MAVLRKKLNNRNTIILPLRLYIGLLFIYASLHKIGGAADFAHTIENYEVLPYWSINAVALVLPWLEFWTGVFLVTGFFVRSNALLSGIFLATFSLAMLINILRGSNIDCGCFSQSTNHPITTWTVVRDGLWMAIAIIIFVLERRVCSFRRFSNKRIV